MLALFDFKVNRNDSPIWASAIHDGHQTSPTIAPYFQLDEQARLREEDPYTACMAELPVNQFLVSTSRFQLDINRALPDAVYLRPEQAWGLHVWKETLPGEILQSLYLAYDDIYARIDQWVQETINRHGYFVWLDIHSYNAKRQGPDEVVDQQTNPQINLGTQFNHARWRPLIDIFLDSASSQQLAERPVDIRENVKFKGGHLAQHLLQKYGDQGCVLSIEFRKDFMDEWTGVPYMPFIQEYKQLLMHTLKDLQALQTNGLTR
ncbi:N-formylglutamate amidohydrolase [Sphingobacterium suaedae]|uniref:N-formylglutamate amidohydrolase n=1 Tax=Sphingobacterium suaedae TaxID=1686402 RepID=A0ABW5KGP2_9SPHI